MRPPSLKTRISLALLVAFILVAGIATVFAKASFRENEVRHVREDSQARVDVIAGMVDRRFLSLGQDAKDAAEDAGNIPGPRVLEELRRAGFIDAIIIGANGTIVERMGGAVHNESLAELMLSNAPPPGFPASVYRFQKDQFLVGSRSLDLKTAVVGGMSRDYLAETFLVDVLIHPEYAHGVIWNDGRVLAASANHPDDRSSIEFVSDNKTNLLDLSSHEDEHYAQYAGLIIIDAKVEGLVSSEGVGARVDAMTIRFILSMAVAFGIGGAITILLVTYSFRPLDRITDAARRLGRGDEDLKLVIRERDELGTLADALNQSAAAIAAARRAETARAEEARLSAEDFELAVGDLSRSVGEAETPSDVGARIAEGLLRVTAARAVLVRHGNETIACADRAEDSDPSSLAALFASDPTAFHVAHTRSADADLQVAVLADNGSSITPAEARKLDILVAQGSIAIHRAKNAVELKRAKAQKETFLDILSHDLKNPLAVARGRVELLGVREPALTEKLAPIEKSLERATRIIEEALLLSKLERAEQLERAPLDVVALAEESAASLRPLAAPRGVAIELEAPESVRWPASRLLARAVENLISNAVKWSPDGKAVQVRVEDAADVCRILIIDHGPGIPAADRARLFARFERADRSGVKGTGLGLAIAKRVTEMHSGSIHITDTPGGGCTFIIEIPPENAALIKVDRT